MTWPSSAIAEASSPDLPGIVLRVELVAPTLERLPGYLDAVRRGWPGDRVLFGSADAVLALAAENPQAVLDRFADRTTAGVRYRRDGTTAPRLPALLRWMWDGEFAGTIDLRWSPDGEALPDDVPGHIGYGTVEWKRGRGYAGSALDMMLVLAAEEGMTEVELVTDVDNLASQRVVERNGGIRVQEFAQVERLGGGRAIRWRIGLA
jgi:predicted acetyltransferase